MAELIRFENISKSFKGTYVVRGLNLSFNKGDMIGLIGLSGAGKTTLMRLFLGYYGADEGKIVFNGKDITANLDFLKNIVGFCTQENSFYHELTVEENLFYFGRMYKVKNLEKRVRKLLELVQLSGYGVREAGDLSGGMKRRLDLAICMLHDPEILILDEPTTGLDPKLRADIWELIKAINKEGKTIIVSSHLLDFIEVYCNKVAILNRGRIAAFESPKKLRQTYAKEKNFSEVFAKVIQNDK